MSEPPDAWDFPVQHKIKELHSNEPELSKPSEAGSSAARVQRWSAPECPFAIDYSAEVLGRIRQRSVEAFHTLPHGGLEIGGVLFGRVMPNARNPLRVEIAAERPIECAHAAGPSFVLSEEEVGGVSAMLERTRFDAEIAALSVVGYWVSHSRTHIGLTLDDEELFKKLFPYPWQIILVMKPEMGAPTRAAFFFRANGRVHPHAASHEFLAEPEKASDQRPTAPESEKYQPLAPERRGKLAAFAEIAAQPTRPVRDRKPIRVLPIVLLMLVSAAAGAAGSYYLHDFQPPSATRNGHDPDLNLEIFAAGPELLIHWNPRALAIQNAARGELIVQEGSTLRTMPLDVSALLQDFLRHKRVRGDVRVTLKVFEQDGALEQASAHFAAAAAP